MASTRTYLAGAVMNIYYMAAVWLGLALLASVVSIRVAVPAALIEIVVRPDLARAVGPTRAPSIR
jgi:hypothetical protein